MEDIQKTLDALLVAFHTFKAGQDIKSLTYDENQDVVCVVYENGYQVLVKVQGEIGFGLLREILWHMQEDDICGQMIR